VDWQAAKKSGLVSCAKAQSREGAKEEEEN
jgi:hypothetical protein